MGKCTAIFKLLRWEFCVAPIKKRNTWVLFQSRVKVLVNQMAFRVEIQWMWTYLPHGHFWYPVSAGHNLFSVMTFWKGSKRGTTQSPSFTAICQTGTKKKPQTMTILSLSSIWPKSQQGICETIWRKQLPLRSLVSTWTTSKVSTALLTFHTQAE